MTSAGTLLLMACVMRVVSGASLYLHPGGPGGVSPGAHPHLKGSPVPSCFLIMGVQFNSPHDSGEGVPQPHFSVEDTGAQRGGHLQGRWWRWVWPRGCLGQEVALLH